MARAVRILAIDGEEIILKSIQRALKSDKDTTYIVSTASTALEGLRLARGNTFDLIFVDFALPGFNSSEVLRRIKNTYPATSVVIMSGYSSNRPPTGGVSNYADSVLQKPFTTGEIRSLVSEYIRQQRAERAEE